MIVWQDSIYAIPALIAAIVCTGLWAYTFPQRQKIIVRQFLLLLSAIIWWLCSYTLEILSLELHSKVLFAQFEYIGIVFTPVFWYIFSRAYANKPQLPQLVKSLLLFFPCITLIVLLTNPYHHFFWQAISIVNDDHGAMFVSEFGTWFWVHLAFSYGLLALGSMNILARVVRSRGERIVYQSLIIVIAALIPWIFNIVYITGLFTWDHVDLTPIGFTLTAILFWWSIIRFYILDPMIIAREQLLELLDQAIIILNKQQRIIDINASGVQIFGCEKNTLINTSISALLPQAKLDPNNPDPQTQRIQIMVGQTVRQFEWSVTPYFQHDSELQGTILVGRDITEQEAMNISIQRQALIFENVLDSVILTNQVGIIIDCNQATTRLFGYSREELIGSTAALWHDQDRISSQTTASIREALQYYGRWKGIIPFIDKSGYKGLCEVIVVPLMNEADEQIASIGISRDVTEQVNAEMELLAQKELFENLVAVAKATTKTPDLAKTLRNTLDISVAITKSDEGSLFLLDQHGAIEQSILVQKNLPVAQRDELIGMVFDKGFAGWIARNQQGSVIEDTHTDPRWLNLDNAPYRFRSALGVPIMGTQGLLGLLMLFHIQPHYFSEAYLYQMEAAAAQIALSISNAQIYEQQRILAHQLQEARDLAESISLAKSQFIANMSHELRTPLNAVIGYSDMLLEDVTDDQDPFLTSSLQKIRVSGHQLLGLVNDVLDIARIESGRMPVNWDYIDPIMLVESVYAVTKPQIEIRKNTFEYQIADDMAMFLSDYPKIQRVLINLVSNAAKFTYEGLISINITLADPMILMVIQDTGIGMSQEQLERVFEPFTQADSSTSRKYGGTGLGLSITQHLIDVLGGSLQLTSELGVGSRFTIQLPLLKEIPLPEDY